MFQNIACSQVVRASKVSILSFGIDTRTRITRVKNGVASVAKYDFFLCEGSAGQEKKVSYFWGSLVKKVNIIFPHCKVKKVAVSWPRSIKKPPMLGREY